MIVTGKQNQKMRERPSNDVEHRHAGFTDERRGGYTSEECYGDGVPSTQARYRQRMRLLTFVKETLGDEAVSFNGHCTSSKGCKCALTAMHYISLLYSTSPRERLHTNRVVFRVCAQAKNVKEGLMKCLLKLDKERW